MKTNYISPMNIINSKSLLNYNSFKINATASLFATVKNKKDILELLSNPKINKKPKLILGEGSNILITKNITGLVIHNKIKGIKIIKEDKKSSIIEVGAGENWDDFVKWSTQHKFYGIENLSLIPGSVGAAPIQNIGAYGVELKDVFIKLEAIDLTDLKTQTFNKSDCLFGYRESIFKNQLKNKLIITKVFIKLNKTKKINVTYHILKEKIKQLDFKKLDSQKIREIIIEIRNSKLPNPKKIGNAGSFFKNPIINQKQLIELQKEYPEIPFFKKEKIKIPAAWLIEKLNWKGYQEESCGVYEKHALILINHNKATGEEIANLSKNIKQSVYKKFNIILEEEVCIL